MKPLNDGVNYYCKSCASEDWTERTDKWEILKYPMERCPRCGHTVDWSISKDDLLADIKLSGDDILEYRRFYECVGAEIACDTIENHFRTRYPEILKPLREILDPLRERIDELMVQNDDGSYKF